MSLIAQTDVFKGKLLELLGVSKEDILRTYAAPARRVEGSQAERLIWMEEFRDDASGRAHPVALMVRLLNGRAWAVGAHAMEFLFVVSSASSGHYVEARPRPTDVDPWLINWVCRDPVGNYYNFGLDY